MFNLFPVRCRMGVICSGSYLFFSFKKNKEQKKNKETILPFSCFPLINGFIIRSLRKNNSRRKIDAILGNSNLLTCYGSLGKNRISTSFLVIAFLSSSPPPILLYAIKSFQISIILYLPVPFFLTLAFFNLFFGHRQ